MNKDIGKTFKIVRISKHLSLKDIGGEEISSSQISRFENGKSELTVEKFFYLLNKLEIGFDEFESIYENYGLSNGYVFRQTLIEAYDAKDEHVLRKMVQQWEKKCHENPEDVYLKLTTTVVRAFLNLVTKSVKFRPEELDRVEKYLISVDNWGRFEFWVFGNCITILDDKDLEFLGNIAMGKTEFYQVLSENKRSAIRTFYNLAFVSLERGLMEQSMKYLNHLDQINLSVDFLYEKLLIRYLKGWYGYKKGFMNGLEEMKKCEEMLWKLGARDKARELRKEIKKIES